VLTSLPRVVIRYDVTTIEVLVNVVVWGFVFVFVFAVTWDRGDIVLVIDCTVLLILGFSKLYCLTDIRLV
jgi:hypothetical protein